jgi:hypothetical protein
MRLVLFLLFPSSTLISKWMTEPNWKPYPIKSKALSIWPCCWNQRYGRGNQVWWSIPVIPPTWETKVGGGSWSKGQSRKKHETWVQATVPQKKKNRKHLKTTNHSSNINLRRTHKESKGKCCLVFISFITKQEVKELWSLSVLFSILHKPINERRQRYIWLLTWYINLFYGP